MPLIDAEVLESLRELQSEDDPDFVKNYYNMYFNALPDMLSSIHSAIRTQNFAKLESTAHALKSSSANAGIEIVRSTADTLETLAKNHSLEGAEAKWTELKKLFADLESEISAL